MPAHLKAVGIAPVHDLPGVGENLQDHLEVYFQLECLQPVSLLPKLKLFAKGLIGLEWLLFKTGLGATNHFESCGFIRSARRRRISRHRVSFPADRHPL